MKGMVRCVRDYLPAIVIGLALFLFPLLTNGCTCEIHGDGSPRSFMRHAKAVFVGEVLEVRETTPAERKEVPSPFERFRVERYWKGIKTIEITVHTDLHGCGPNLEVGKRYLVYAMGKELETARSGTKELTGASADLQALGPGTVFKP